jgi:hypothetical protein
MAEDADKPKSFLGLNGTQTVGSALAAVTSAFVGSFLGVAGTLVGAALGSLVATIAGAVYSHTLNTAAKAARNRIPRRGQGLAADDGGQPEPHGSFRAKRPLLQFTPRTWLKIGGASAAVFVIAMAGITAIEFGTQKPISKLVSSTSKVDDGGGTTLGDVFGGERVSRNTDKKQDTKDTPQQQDPDQQDGTTGETEQPSAPADPGQDGTGAGTDGTGAGTDGTGTGTDGTGGNETVPTQPADPGQQDGTEPTAPAQEQAPAVPADPGQGAAPGGDGGTGQ